MQREKAAMDATYGKRFNQIDTDKKVIGRRLNAKNAIKDAERSATVRSLQNWKSNQKEIVLRKEYKVKRERLLSAKNYKKNNGLDYDDTQFNNYANYTTMMNRAFDGASSTGRPMSGDLTRSRVMHSSDLAHTKLKDDLRIDMENDAVSQQNSSRPKRLGHSASRPKSSYSAIGKDGKRDKLIENQRIEYAMSDYNTKLFNATVNLENIRA